MIIIGYPGIGKSSNSGVYPVQIGNEGHWIGYIDLESHNFWNEHENIDGFGHRGDIRDPNWFKTYCKIAKDLSNQGYRVFVSSHAAVQKELRQYKNGEIIVCYPNESLKQKWILKLRERYIQTAWMGDESISDKALKALEAVIENFDRDIDAMRHSGFPALEITDMDYQLRKLIDDFYSLREHWYE